MVGKIRRQKASGVERFNGFFNEVYGSRWPFLKECLLREPLKVARVNRFFENEKALGKWHEGPALGPSLFSDLFNFELLTINNTFSYDDFLQAGKFPAESQIWPFYRMDPASLFVPQVLQVQLSDSVLDMCAAPGGKSLALVEGLGEQGQITLNEYSSRRRYRLMSVVKNYLPPPVRRRVHITGKDGAQFRLKPDTFDKVMIDAPCSGERELLHKPADMNRWKPSRTKRFGLKQYSLLAAGLTSLKPGGLLAYSTCSLSPMENDDVIGKLIKRRGGEFALIALEYPVGESTRYGWHFLPDNCLPGRKEPLMWGPIFVSLLRKKDNKSCL